MNKEHYEHIVERFDTEQRVVFLTFFLECSSPSDMKVERYTNIDGDGGTKFRIVWNYTTAFQPFDTEQQAEEALEYIRDTEILFI